MSDDQSFNDDELQDIMNEIESLEKEFVEEESTDASLVQNDTSGNDNLESEITEAVNAESKIGEEAAMSCEAQSEPVTEEIDTIEGQSLGTSDTNMSLTGEVPTAEGLTEETITNSDNDHFNSDNEPVDSVLQEDDSTGAHSNIIELSNSNSKEKEGESSPTHGAELVNFSGEGNVNLKINYPVGSKHACVEVGDGVQVTMEGIQISLNEEGCHVEIEGGINFNIPLSQPNSKKNVA